MFSASFTAALNAASHSAHTYKPRSTRLTVVFSTAGTTRLARVPFRYVYDVDALDVRFVFEYIGEAVERPSVQVEIPVFPPVFRLTGLILSNTSEFLDIDLYFRCRNLYLD